ncbi:hypothetical protein [Streptomyces radiopugnans]|uniref:hypothetical protein n=1 Tax=Streptomyces radiopugnans TaxID=403935 RepID=UPI003F1C5F57
MSGPTVDEYRALLTGALGEAPDANTSGPDFRTLFTPTSHRLALAPDVTVVRGARGTGKTYWAKALTDPRLREVAAAAYMMPRLRDVRVVTGFGLEGGDDPAFPDKRTIGKLVDDKVSPGDLWSAVVLKALGTPRMQQLGSWSERIRWARENPEAYGAALRRADRETRERGQTLIVLFDALDHLHPDRRQAEKLLSALFEVALELRLTTGALRAKIFVRPDMYENAPRNFTDASKLDANATDLTWSRENLFGLLFHQLGNHTGAEAGKFRAATGTWRSEDGRYVAPVELLADRERQEEVFTTLAGPFMGPDRRRGHTSTWVINHLQDGLGRVSPRTWLHTLCRSATLTRERRAGHTSPLHYDSIRESLSSASELRVRELREDIGWAVLALKQFNGTQVPMEPSAVHYLWRTNSFWSKLRQSLEGGTKGSGPRVMDDPFALLEELTDLGVVSIRPDGAVDLPDIYRLAFDISRRGGVARRPVR